MGFTITKNQIKRICDEFDLLIINDQIPPYQEVYAKFIKKYYSNSNIEIDGLILNKELDIFIAGLILGMNYTTPVDINGKIIVKKLCSRHNEDVDLCEVCKIIDEHKKVKPYKPIKK